MSELVHSLYTFTSGPLAKNRNSSRTVLVKPLPKVIHLRSLNEVDLLLREYVGRLECIGQISFLLEQNAIDSKQ